MENEAAVEAAVDSCIEDAILVDILRKERARVRNILISALTEEEITRLREYEREMDRKEAWEDGLAVGLSEGEISKAISVVNNLTSSAGIPLDRACELAEISVEEYLDYTSSH